MSRIRGQWFEGWFLRLTDHDAASTVSVIFGSLRRQRRPASHEGPFDEHLIAVGYADGRDGAEHTQQLLLSGPSVRLTGGNVRSRSPPAAISRELGISPNRIGPQLSWWSQQHGGMHVRGDAAELDLSLPGGMRLVANISAARVHWDPTRPDTYGPEGWLSRTGLLPCHYFVHSFGSPTTYTLTHAADGRRRLSGHAVAHVERNWGDSFPSGWVWAQAAAAHGRAYLVLTGGRFVIGPLTTESYVIGLRSVGGGGAGGDDGLSWDFRTTDLDRVVDVRRPCDGLLSVNATSRNGRRRLELVLHAPPSTFGEALHVPTSDRGFSKEPGCREAHTAVVRIRAWEILRRRGQRDEEVQRLQAEVPMAVLEFGGNFQC